MTWRRGLTLVAPLVAAYVALVVLAWVFQRRLLYAAAGRADVGPPADARLVAVRAADGITTHALHFEAADAPRTIVYFHGNGEVMGDDVDLARALVHAGFSVALVEYRGYGHSAPGDPTEEGLYADGKAVLDALARDGVGADKVILWGTSLGSGVAAELASRGLASGLILVSPYTSMADVAAFHFPWLPAGLLVRDRYDTLRKASSIRVPTVVLHGTKDEVVPFTMGEDIARAIEGARLVRVEGGHHNDLFARGRAARIAELTRMFR